MLSFKKPLRAGAIGLGAVAVALGASMPAAAQSSAAPAPADVSEGPSADAQIVVKDGDTGKLRHATPEEARALHAGRANARAGTSMQSRSHWSGARGARLTDDFMTFTVVVKRADGKLVELCVEGGETTAKLVTSAPQFKSDNLPTE